MRITLPLTLLCCSLLLAACSTSKDEEVRQWMAAERNQARPKVKPIPAPIQFVPEAYSDTTAVDPFSSQKLARALSADATQAATNGALIAPELKRRKEPLEAFPLDSMVMVGSLLRSTQPAALVKVDNLLYQVKVGNYLGQNYGRITKIAETEVTLREIVQDAVGEWVERVATLQLQEKAK